MSLDTKYIQKVLQKCLVLIVDDDASLANGISELFKGFTEQQPDIAHSIEGAMGKLRDKKGKYSLVVVDVMLPRTETDYTKIAEFQEKLSEVTEKIQNADNGSEDAKKEIAMLIARKERSRMLQEIDEIIDISGGIKLVKKMYQEKIIIPIYFLSAVGEKKRMEEGLKIAKDKSDWGVKPLTGNRILEKCVNLLERVRPERG
jgi:DNA-binding response OmpR family regulator